MNFGRLQTCILNEGKSVIRPLFSGPEDLSFLYEIVSETISKNSVLNGKAISLIAFSSRATLKLDLYNPENGQGHNWS